MLPLQMPTRAPLERLACAYAHSHADKVKSFPSNSRKMLDLNPELSSHFTALPAKCIFFLVYFQISAMVILRVKENTVSFR